MKALTIRQPWANAIAHGTKRVENRTWNTRYRGRLLIHSAAAIDKQAVVHGHHPDTRSAILAIATLTDCHYDERPGTICCSEWAEPAVYHWALTDVSPLPEPIPCKGRLGLWTPSDDTITAALNQQATAQ